MKRPSMGKGISKMPEPISISNILSYDKIGEHGFK